MDQMLQLVAANHEFFLSDLPEWTTEVVPFSQVENVSKYAFHIKRAS